MSEWNAYWCHECRREFEDQDQEDLVCFYCQSELIEKVELEEPHPREFVPETEAIQEDFSIMLVGVALNPITSPASSEAMEQCPTLHYEEVPERCSECCVCKNSFEKNSNILMLPCTHIFHKTCVTDWFRIKNTCPMCRYLVLELQ